MTVVNTGSVRVASRGGRGIALAAATAGPLELASDTGGAPKLFTRLEPGESTHRFPHFLPDDRAILFAAGSGTVNLHVAVYSITTGQKKTLVTAGTSPRYVLPGYLIYAQDGSLMAVPFDQQRLEVTGNPVPVVDGVLQSLANGFAH